MGPRAERGLVLTPTYRVAGGQPEVHLHAVLESGELALVVDDRCRPYLFVRAGDAERARRLAPAARRTPTDLRTVAGEPVARVEVDLPDDVPPLRTRLGEAGVECLEAAVRFASRYLIARGIRGASTVEGPFEQRPGVGRVYRDPDLVPAVFTPRLRVLAFDIETTLDGQHLYALAAAGTGGDRVCLVRRAGAGAAWSAPIATADPDAVHAVDGEQAALEAVLAHLRAADPDVLTGWNAGDFDVPVLLRIARRRRLRLALGRTDDEVEVRRDPGFTREPRVIAPGRQVLDGLALVRGALVRLDDYRLETAARMILGRGKLIGPRLPWSAGPPEERGSPRTALMSPRAGTRNDARARGSLRARLPPLVRSTR